MPAKATLYNLKCEPVFDFGTGPRNLAYYNPHGTNILSASDLSLSSFIHFIVSILLYCIIIALIFTRESSYCFQRVLAITILSVCLSVTRVDQSKTV